MNHCRCNKLLNRKLSPLGRLTRQVTVIFCHLYPSFNQKVFASRLVDISNYHHLLTLHAHLSMKRLGNCPKSYQLVMVCTLVWWFWPRLFNTIFLPLAKKTLADWMNDITSLSTTLHAKTLRVQGLWPWVVVFGENYLQNSLKPYQLVMVMFSSMKIGLISSGHLAFH